MLVLKGLVGLHRTVQLQLLQCYWLHLAQAAATGAFSAGGCPASEVRGRSREDPMPERRRPRGVTLRPRSGAAAESARLQRCKNDREELPDVRGQGREPGGHCHKLLQTQQFKRKEILNLLSSILGQKCMSGSLSYQTEVTI